MDDHNTTQENIMREVETTAKNYLNDVRDVLKDTYPNLELDDIRLRDIPDGVAWDFVGDTNGDVTSDEGREMFDAQIEITSSIGYEEGEMLGYAVTFKMVWADGEIIAQHTPKNYTDEVWTDDINEIKNRIQNFPKIEGDILE